MLLLVALLTGLVEALHVVLHSTCTLQSTFSRVPHPYIMLRIPISGRKGPVYNDKDHERLAEAVVNSYAP
jgi:hypothetical protein